jgi:hypothetical protein
VSMTRVFALLEGHGWIWLTMLLGCYYKKRGKTPCCGSERDFSDDGIDCLPMTMRFVVVVIVDVQ